MQSSGSGEEIEDFAVHLKGSKVIQKQIFVSFPAFLYFITEPKPYKKININKWDLFMVLTRTFRVYSTLIDSTIEGEKDKTKPYLLREKEK